MSKMRPRKPRGARLGKLRRRMLLDRLHGAGASTPPVVVPPVNATYVITVGANTAGDVKGYKDPASTVGGFGSIDKTALGPDKIFAIEAKTRTDGTKPKQIEVVLANPTSTITNMNITVDGISIDLYKHDSKIFYLAENQEPKAGLIYDKIFAATGTITVIIKGSN